MEFQSHVDQLIAFVRDHSIWAPPVVFALAFGESLAFISLLIPAWGALEIAVRWAWLQVDSATFGDPNVPGSVQYADPLRSARTARAWTGGLTWVPRRSFHLAADFEQTVFKGGAGTVAAPADRKTENVFVARAQFNF